MEQSLLQASLQAARGLRQILGASWLVEASFHVCLHLLMALSYESISKPALHIKVSAAGGKVLAAPASGHFCLILLYTQLPYQRMSYSEIPGPRTSAWKFVVTVRSVAKPCMHLFHTLSALLRSLNCEVYLITSFWSSGVFISQKTMHPTMSALLCRL